MLLMCVFTVTSEITSSRRFLIALPAHNQPEHFEFAGS